jgi:hypothetical protein
MGDYIFTLIIFTQTKLMDIVVKVYIYLLFFFFFVVGRGDEVFNSNNKY